jgi:hypothetical protein
MRALNPHQLHAIARRWARFTVGDYHTTEHGLDLATRVAEVAYGWALPPTEWIYEAMHRLELAGVDCPAPRSSWAMERKRWAGWLGVRGATQGQHGTA